MAVSQGSPHLTPVRRPSVTQVGCARCLRIPLPRPSCLQSLSSDYLWASWVCWVGAGQAELQPLHLLMELRVAQPSNPPSKDS